MEQAESTSAAFWYSLLPDTRQGITSATSDDELKQIRSGPETSESLIILEKAAEKLSEQGNHKAASQVLNHVLSARQNSPNFGPEHTDTLSTLWKLAIEQDSLGQSAEAEKSWRKLLKIHDTKGGLTGLGIMYNLGRTLNEQKKYGEAEPLLRKVLPELEKEIGKESQQTIGCLRELSESVGALRGYAEAKELNEEGVALIEKTQLSEEDRAEYLEGMREVRAKIEEWESTEALRVKGPTMPL
ncbi:hypothetical protein G7Y89_g5343 [Cudoniella acicularis]|uniref:Uncharacterized protein n=1 Tax=Cudoniella acicularis TaxID=354080 RepID=A0A8H4W6K4_9HELO|nr:hypothetical protein G7Y89_g5343 [Cudoniella acicularis]